MDTVHDSEVKDRQSFIRFLELLHQDYIKNGSEWENNNLERFLETMSAYTNDIQGFYDNTAQNVNADTASWKVFADILRALRCTNNSGFKFNCR